MLSSASAGPSGIAPGDMSLSFLKGLTVLKCFDAETPQMSIPEIARKSGLDRAVVRRLVLTLVHLGYVRAEGSRYALTPRILVLAGGFLQGRRMGLAVQPVLDAFAVQIGRPLVLAMRDGTDAVLVAQAQSLAVPPRLGFTLGSRLPLAESALGRALLAGETPEAARALCAALGTGEEGLRAVDAARARGIATATGLVEAGVFGAAATVKGASGDLAAVGFSVHASEGAAPDPAPLLTAARALAALL